MMRHLILVIHAQPAIDADIPAAEWTLTDEGKQKSRLLVKSFEQYGVTRVFTSHEPKAHETGCIPAKLLGLLCEIASDLHEHDRRGEPFHSKQVFMQKLETFFNQPETQSFGNESAQKAQARFAAAVDELIKQYPDDTLAITTHGTVMALYHAQKCGIDPIPFWKALKSPMVVVLELPEFHLAEVITEFA